MTARQSSVVLVGAVLLASCIHHPPETVQVEHPAGPIPDGAKADTSRTFLVVDRYYVESYSWWDDVKADTAVCRESRSECLDRHEGEIEKTVLKITPDDEPVTSST